MRVYSRNRKIRCPWFFFNHFVFPLWHRAVVCAVLQHRYTDSWCRYHPVPFPQYTSPALPTFADFKKANKTSVRDVQNVQNNLSGTGVRRAPGRLHFRNAPVMKNRKFSLCCKMYPLILRFRFLCVFNSLYLLSFKPDWYSPVVGIAGYISRNLLILYKNTCTLFSASVSFK